MFKGKTLVITSLSLVLLLASTTLAVDKSKSGATKRRSVAGASNKRKGNKARYANQEVGYRKQGGSNQLLPYVEHSNLKEAKPNQQGILPYVEQSNLRSRKAQTGQ